MLTNVNDEADNEIDTINNKEIINIDVDLDEQCIWYKNENESDENNISQLNINKLASWILVGDQNDSLKYRSTFCSSELVNDIEILQNFLSKFSAEEIDSARKRCNPLENLKRLFFVNRSAVKCANLDKLINLTNRSEENYAPMIDRSNATLVMADIDGPGCGFVDYILWRTGWLTKAYACVENNVQIDRFATNPESLDTYKSHIMSLSAVATFNKFIRQTVRCGVHLVICDGSPSSLNVNEYGKELKVKPYLVLYTIYALSLLRENGIFILKLFEVFTPFTVGLIYIIHKCFKEISIVKPAYSRPSNSERYLICKLKKRNTQIIQEHLSNTYEAMLNLNKDQQLDIMQLVPINVLKEDQSFFEYIFERNNSIVKKQLYAMNILKKYLENENLECSTKDEYRLKCLQLWNLPEIFEKPIVIDAGIYCNRLLNLGDNDNKSNELIIVDQLLTTSADLEGIFINLENWYFVPVSITNNNTVRTFFLSQGSTNVYMYENNKWTIVSDSINLSLPARTLVYAELTTDINSSSNEYKESNGFHIIDGLFLGGRDIRKLKLLERNELCKKFAKSINCQTNHVRNSKYSYSRYRKAEKYCKTMEPIYDLIDYIAERNRMWRICGDNDNKNIVHYIPRQFGPQKYYRLNGILFFNANVDDPSGICAPVLWNWQLNNNVFNLLSNPFSFVEKRTDNIYLAHFKQFLYNMENKEIVD